MIFRTRLKVCCMASPEDIRLAVAYGADALGFVGPMPSGVGPLSISRITELVPLTPPPVASVLLTSKLTAPEILFEARECGCNTVQIVAHIDPAEYPALRRIRALRFLQVVHVEDRASIALAKDYAGLADALLLDSGRPSQDELGGTGRTHDWGLSAEIVRSVATPVLLAGGLDASNIVEAVRTVRPYGVDLCSRIRTDGKLDEAKLKAFAEALAAA